MAAMEASGKEKGVAVVSMVVLKTHLGHKPLKPAAPNDAPQRGHVRGSGIRFESLSSTDESAVKNYDAHHCKAANNRCVSSSISAGCTTVCAISSPTSSR